MQNGQASQFGLLDMEGRQAPAKAGTLLAGGNA